VKVEIQYPKGKRCKRTKKVTPGEGGKKLQKWEKKAEEGVYVGGLEENMT